MWVNNDGDYVTNTQFVTDYPAAPHPSDITSIWRVDALTNSGYPFIPLMIDLPRLELNPVRQNDYITVYCAHKVNGVTVYPSIETIFYTNGDAILTPTSCDVEEIRNGMWSVSMTHPIDKEKRYKLIVIGAMLKVLGQAFTIKKVTETWNGNSGYISVYAEHIFYQLNDVWIYPRERLIGVNGHFSLYAIMHSYSEEQREGSFNYSFSYESDLVFTDSMWIIHPDNGCTPIECILGSGGLIEMKGGELYRNNTYFSVNERMENAEDDAFTIRVGENLSGISRNIDTSSMITYFQAFDPWGGTVAWAWNFGTFFGDLFPHYVVRSQNFDFPKEAENEDWDYSAWFFGEFNDMTLSYLLKNGKPIVCYELTIEDVRKNPDFEFISSESLDKLRIGDKGQIWDSRFDAEKPITLEITGTVYDGITGKCKKVTIGDKQSFVGSSMPSISFEDLEPEEVESFVLLRDGNGDVLYDGNDDRLVQYREVINDG